MSQLAAAMLAAMDLQKTGKPPKKVRQAKGCLLPETSEGTIVGAAPDVETASDTGHKVVAFNPTIDRSPMSLERVEQIAAQLAAARAEPGEIRVGGKIVRRRDAASDGWQARPDVPAAPSHVMRTASDGPACGGIDYARYLDALEAAYKERQKDGIRDRREPAAFPLLRSIRRHNETFVRPTDSRPAFLGAALQLWLLFDQALTDARHVDPDGIVGTDVDDLPEAANENGRDIAIRHKTVKRTLRFELPGAAGVWEGEFEEQVPAEVRQSRSERLIYMHMPREDIGRECGQWLRHVDGAPVAFPGFQPERKASVRAAVAQFDAETKWEFGPERVIKERRNITVDVAGKAKKRRETVTTIVRDVTCTSPAGTSLWRQVRVKTPGRKRHKDRLVLVRQTVARTVDNANSGHLLGSLEIRSVALRKLGLLQSTMTRDEFEALRLACVHGHDFGQIGAAIGADGVTICRTALIRAAEVLARLATAEDSDDVLPPSFWVGLGIAAATPAPANDDAPPRGVHAA